MSYKLKYSPAASDKLRELRDNPEKGPSVEALFGIPTPYRVLHVEHNYAFYRLEEDTVQKANYAVKLYKKAGFAVADENGEEYIMVCRL